VDTTSKPKLKLTGTDGNAFFILVRCSKAGKRAGWDQTKIQAFLTDATAGDYDNLLHVVSEWFEVS